MAQSAGWHDLCQLSMAEKLWQLFLASDAQAFFYESQNVQARKRKGTRSERSPLDKDGSREVTGGSHLHIVSMSFFTVEGAL